MSLPPQPAILSRPFFEDKNRAFWTLQAAGWTGYLILRSVSSISNASDMTSMVPVVIESIVGYSITLLLSTLYHYYRRQPRFAMAILTVLTLAAATLVYAVLDAFSFSFINARNPGLNIGLVLGTIFLNFTVLAGWT
ncbi:MAG: sensor histidine kinase, partial [Pseudomonadota bacterium]